MKSPRDKDFCRFFFTIELKTLKLTPWCNDLKLDQISGGSAPKNQHITSQVGRRFGGFSNSIFGAPGFFVGATILFCKEGIWLITNIGGFHLAFLRAENSWCWGSHDFYWMKSWSLKRVVFPSYFPWQMGILRGILSLVGLYIHIDSRYTPQRPTTNWVISV